MRAARRTDGRFGGRTISWALGLLLGFGCGTGEGGRGPRGEHSRGNATVGGAVISTVEGHAITVGDVRALVEASGLAPREALERLQAERVLMAEAERRGFAADREVSWVARQARAQALLEDVARSASVGDDELRAAYDRQRTRFVQPERRASVHVLAKLPAQPTPEQEAAAEAFAIEMIAALREADDIEAFLARAKGEERAFEVVAQRVPATDRHGRLVEPYLAALFSQAEPGMVPAPVRTTYGWHAIRVTEILPAIETPFEAAAATLREELLVERRKQLVDRLLARARDEHGVEVSSAAAQALATLEL